jgi:hypothetical protein
MNDSTRVMRRPGRAWPPTARTAAAIIATAVLALLAAACSSSGSSASSGGSSNAAGSTGSASGVAFSACMRSHGLAEFPDPDSNGSLPKVTPQQLGVGSSAYQAAQNACAHLLQPSTAQAQQTLNGMLDFARCMRSHGVRDWPDPTFDSNGQPVFELRGRVNPKAPQASRTADECSRLLHAPPGQDGVVLCNGIGEAGCHHYGRPAG